jgi:hypothetical protein
MGGNELLRAAAIDPARRAETLTVGEFNRLLTSPALALAQGRDEDRREAPPRDG